MIMKKLSLGLIVGSAPFLIISSTVAQYNTSDPDAFLRREARSCQGCNLSGADLSNQERVNAQLRQANLTNANLRDSNFRGAYFTCANLSNANLADSNFSYANFVDANLTGVNLRGADLSKTDLSGAIIDPTTDFSSVNLDGAKLWDAKTLYQPGLDLSTIPRNDDLEKQRVRCQNE
jgi:uncharacterized protein YjbI with pentapeptide repeats